MKRIYIVIVVLVLGIFQYYDAGAQARRSKNKTAEMFAPLCDSIVSRHNIFLGIEKLEVSKVLVRGKYVDVYFNRVLAGFPLTGEDVRDLYEMTEEMLPQEYRKYRLGKIFTNNSEVSRYEVYDVGNDGRPAGKCPSGKTVHARVVSREGLPYEVTKGLDGRNIALWQSHGYYFEETMDRWEWQRARIFQTVEDLYTQSYVIPFLVPMLENAGAYVFLPRERDMGDVEIVVDNDDARGFSSDGKIDVCGKGFGAKEFYVDGENPFRCGTAVSVGKQARWTAHIPETGDYAVHVSYMTVPESSDEVVYEVHHAGGVALFTVNQKMGGGTWIYLGTFRFEEDSHAKVVMYRKSQKGVMTADAVRIGGGMGNIARGQQPCVSGYPRWCEGARYWLQYAGYSPEVYRPNEGKSDYRDDFMSRGLWVGALTGGSKVNPKQPGKGVPVDLAFGFHTDAGVFCNDSIIGTLAIHTLKSDGSQRYPSGEDRITSRYYANYVQTQIVDDIRALWEPEWARRALWDRSYYEARTPPVPSMLLELLSHQNLADMRYGLDPAFRFTVSRAVYKGMLKYLSDRYDVPYVVQPLPVSGFSSHLDVASGRVVLRWEPVEDELEPTAVPESYIVYTRVGDGAWDEGRTADSCVFETKVSKGEIYSFKVVAVNEGGISFPSEILSVGIPSGNNKGCVLVVNGFDRVSAPVDFASADSTMGGFANRRDSGVPYISDRSFTGEQYEFRRALPWLNDDDPGFGASGYRYETVAVAGNTFDYPYVHGKALFDAGYAFCSTSRDAFTGDEKGYSTVDVILGKQAVTPSDDRYRCFPASLMDALKKFEGNIIVSGSYIATDIWDTVFDMPVDSVYRQGAIKFAESVLKFRKLTCIPAESSLARGCGVLSGVKANFNNDYSPDIYKVDSVDGLEPAKGGSVIMRYSGCNVPAAILYKSPGHSAVAFGFPLETITDDGVLEEIFSRLLDSF